MDKYKYDKHESETPMLILTLIFLSVQFAQVPNILEISDDN
jgi:hypothetical protein